MRIALPEQFVLQEAFRSSSNITGIQAQNVTGIAASSSRISPLCVVCICACLLLTPLFILRVPKS